MKLKIALLEASYGSILQRLDNLAVNGTVIQEISNIAEAVGLLG